MLNLKTMWKESKSICLIVSFIYFTFLVFSFIVLFGCSKPVTTDDPEPFSFCVIGDRTGTHEAGVFRKVVDAALDEDPDFLIDCGDMIEGGTENYFVLTQQWTEYIWLISNIEVPFYHTAGNHDLWFEGQLVQYIQYVGLPYYSFDYESIHVVVLDNSRWVYGAGSKTSLSKTCIDNYFSKEQLLWLYEDLENNNKDHTFIFFHKPFWDMYLKGSNLNNSIHDYFVSKNVTAVFAGHYHNHFTTEYDGIKYVIVGKSGGGSTYDHPDFTSHDPRYVRSEKEYHSFEKVTVSDEVTIEHFDVEDL